ncbi:MAG: hypothetical protein AAF587_41540 [Bacteroidota bacterium]
MTDPSTPEQRHPKLAHILNDKNGCTIPLAVEVDPIFQIHGSSTISINRYFTIHAEPALSIGRERRSSLNDRTPCEVLGIAESDIQLLDFGTVTASRTPNERLQPPLQIKSMDEVRKRAKRFLQTLTASKSRRYQRVSRLLKSCFQGIGSLDDIERKVQSVAIIESILANVPHLAVRLSEKEHTILFTRKKSIAQELGDTVRDMLGWESPTITAESGTYLNAHLSILAGARKEKGGGLHFLTTETGGNAPRAAQLNHLHFGADQAGRQVDHQRETPIFSAAYSPGLVYSAALRDAQARPYWGKERKHVSFGAYIVAELRKAISTNKHLNGNAPFHLVASIADRSKTSTLVSLKDLRIISDFLNSLSVQDGVKKTYLIIDGCQSRGESIKGIYHPRGPVAYFNEQGIAVDAVSWTTSKAPGGAPFAAGLTLTEQAYADLRHAIVTIDEGLPPRDGFIAKYVKQGDFPASENKEDSLIEHYAIADFGHQLRLLGDIPRLWRWATVYTEHIQTIADTKELLAKELAGEGKYFLPMEESSDASVLNVRLNRSLLPDDCELTIIGKLLRLGMDLDQLKHPRIQPYTSYEKAAALLASPTGQTVIEKIHPTLSADASSPHPESDISHEAILRFAINLELAELSAFSPDRRDRLLPKLAQIINTRIRLILEHYEELAAALSLLEDRRTKAEELFYAHPISARYYEENIQGFATR